MEFLLITKPFELSIMESSLTDSRSTPDVYIIESEEKIRYLGM